jgi:hypothetical protein
MTAPNLILRGVYAPDGSALVIVGQPAVLILQLMEPNPSGSGPDVPQDLTGRAFTQQVLNTGNAIVAEVAGMNLTEGQINFTLGSEVIAGLLTGGASAIDLTYQVAEIVTDGLDVILAAPFSVRLASAGIGAAVFTLNTAAPGPLVVRYAGAPGLPGSPGAPGSGGDGAWTNASVGGALAANSRTCADSTAGVLAFTLPQLATVEAGNSVVVADGGGQSAVNPITIAPFAGDQLDKVENQTFILNRPHMPVRFIANVGLTSWQSVMGD